MDFKKLEAEAQPIIEGLAKGFFVDNYPEEMLRTALAYKMWADGQDSELDEILDTKNEFWTKDCVMGYLTERFGCKQLPFKNFPNIGA